MLSEDFLLLHSIICFGFLRIILILFLVLITLHLHLLLILHLLLHGLLMRLQVIHILYIFSILHLCRCHWESFFIEESDYTLLAQHQLNHSFSFVLIKFILFVESTLSTGGSHSAIDTRSLGRCHEVDADTKTRLSRVHFHLGVPLVMFPFRSHFVNGLFKQNLQLGLRSKFLVVLESCSFQKSPLMLHHLAELVHDSVISSQLFLLSFDFAWREIHEWATLLVRCHAAQSATIGESMGGAAGRRRTKVSSPLVHLRTGCVWFG